jgi:hypothetical protein
MINDYRYAHYLRHFFSKPSHLISTNNWYASSPDKHPAATTLLYAAGKITAQHNTTQLGASTFRWSLSCSDSQQDHDIFRATFLYEYSDVFYNSR